MTTMTERSERTPRRTSNKLCLLLVPWALCACDGDKGSDTGEPTIDPEDTGCAGDSPVPEDWPSSTEDVDARLVSCCFMAPLGDVNGDGYADVLLESSGADAAHILHGPHCGVESVDDADVSLLLDGWRMEGAAGAGDIDGDGYSDVLIADFASNSNGLSSGEVHLLLSPLAQEVDPTAEASLTLLGTKQSYLGGVMTGVGDTDGDGTGELLLGGEGAWLVPGNVLGEHAVGDVGIQITGSGLHYVYGMEFAALGDSDGDGLDDFAIRAGTEKVFIFRGPVMAAMTVEDADAEIDLYVKGAIGSNFPAAVGDQDGDGLPDLAIGSNYEGATSTVHVFAGTLTGPHDGDDALAELSCEAYGAAEELDGAGDMNGDGFEDIVIGDESIWFPEVEPVFYLLLGPVEGGKGTLEEQGIAIPNSLDPTYTYGSVAGAGDTNGDGLDDVLIGTLHSGGEDDYHFMGLILGRTSGL